jgi:hypothetical protein
MDYNVDQLEIQWLQLVGIRHDESTFAIKVDHVEDYIFSYDQIIRDAALTDGEYTQYITNTFGQLTIDSTAWTGTNATAIWISTVVDLGEGWQLHSVLLNYIDRVDFAYVTPTIEYRCSDISSDLSALDWLEHEPCSAIDSSARYVQVKITLVTTDSTLTYPVFKSCRLVKTWWIQEGWRLPNTNVKYESGIFQDTTSTPYYGLKLAPSIGASQPYEGWYTSPVHDFGESLFPKSVNWFSRSPLGTYVDTEAGAPEQIQIRGSMIAPSGAWTQDHMPDADDVVWGTSGSLADGWVDISRTDIIINELGIVRYTQFRIKMGVSG